MIKAYKTKKRNRRYIAHETGNAAAMIGPIEKDCEIFGLTGGQFSFIDLLDHCLNEIGEAHCVVSTWTASYASIERAMNFISDSRLKSCKWLVDRSFQSRKPEIVKHLRDVFGDDSIRTASSHAKFMLLWSDDWHLVIRTSMNLNQNKRVEDFEISDDEEFLKYMLRVCDKTFAEPNAGFSTLNETEKITKNFEQTELFKGKICLNTRKLTLKK